MAELFQIDPGAFPQTGIGLPMAFQTAGEGWTAREKSLVLRFLRRAGSECVEGPQDGFRHVLRLTREGDGAVRWTLSDTASGSVVREGTVTPSGRVKRRCAALVKSILEEMYSVH